MNKRIKLFLIILGIKLVPLVLLSSLHKCAAPSEFLGNYSLLVGDAASYIDPIENWLSRDSYFYFNGNENIYAGRMPYYGILYLIPRIFLSAPIAGDLITLLQLLLDVLACQLAILLVYRITGNSLAAFLTFIVISTSQFVSYWNYYLLPESLGINLLVISVYLLITQLKAEKLIVRYSGYAFLSFAVLLKPYFIAFIPIGACMNWLALKNQTSGKRILSSSLAFIIPVLVTAILLSPWTIRNYTISGKFIPMQQNLSAGYNFSKADVAYMNFLKSWGGSITHWDKRSAGCFFHQEDLSQCDYKFPAYLFGKGIEQKDLDEARIKFQNVKKHPSDSLEAIVGQDFDSLTRIIQTNYKFENLIVGPFMIAKQFLFHSGSYYLPISKSNPCFQSPQLVYKMLQSLLYYITLLGGTIGLFIILLQNRAAYWIAVIPVFIIFLFSFVLRATEFRYFLPAYPFLVISFGISFHALGLSRLNNVYIVSILNHYFRKLL